MTVSSNFPEHYLPRNRFAVKDYSENEGIDKWLVEQNIAKPTGTHINGFPVFAFTPEFDFEISKQFQPKPEEEEEEETDNTPPEE